MRFSNGISPVVDADRHGLVGLLRDRDLVAVGDLDPEDGRSVEGVLAGDPCVAGLERLAVVGTQARVDLGCVLRDLAAAEDAVGLHDAVEGLLLAQDLGRLEPDLVLRADLGPLAGVQVDQRVLLVALVDDVEHRAGAGRRERAVDHGRARSAGRPERDGGRDQRDERRDEGEPRRQRVDAVRRATPASATTRLQSPAPV